MRRSSLETRASELGGRGARRGQVAGAVVLGLVGLIDIEVEDRLVERLVRRERLASVEPRDVGEMAARAEHATDLAQGGRPVGHELERERADDHVDRRRPASGIASAGATTIRASPAPSARR